ncbi:hypothetical protein [Pseudoalteromonas sp.]|uniref:hypothetical protein n=1 Tax=Pseudoalteromonas sp. TaxID=53249 RepID=UPI001BCC6279|nr:hypothetical protein [Pseudoalteromonas sp.]
MSQAKVRVNKGSSTSNLIQSGEAEGRAGTINTPLALPVMQGGHLTVYRSDNLRYCDERNSLNELAALLTALNQ